MRQTVSTDAGVTELEQIEKDLMKNEQFLIDAAKLRLNKCDVEDLYDFSNRYLTN